MSDGDRPEREVSAETRDYRAVLEQEIANALQEMRRPAGGLALSGVAAGLNLSFGALFMAMALTFADGFGSALTRQFVLAGVSVIGFLLVLLGQTELFTAHTAMGLLPVLDGEASLRDLGRLWAVIFPANLLGCGVFAVIIALLGPPLDVVDPAAFRTLASALVPYSATTILLSGLVAGWLMGLVTWLVAAARDTAGEFLSVAVVTAGIGFGPFHHSLLGTTEVLAALLLGQGVTVADYGHFLLWTTLGNVVGGVVFVALLNYGQAVRGGVPQDVDVETRAGGEGSAGDE